MQSNRESPSLPGLQPGWGICLALGLSLGFLLLARQGTWTLPQLNWGEGTRMSIASSLNHGRTLYVDAWDHHTFLDILLFQQLFRIFPSDWVPLVLHICNAAIVCALCGLVYLGVARAGAVPVWALGASVVSGYLFSRDWAIAGHGEFYHSLPVALAFYVCFVGPRTRWRMLFAGVLFALGFCIKQTAVFDLAAGLLLILLDAPSHQAGRGRESFRTAASEIGWILMGTLLIAILCAAYFLAHGALRPALYTTFVDPLVYSTGRDPGETLTKFANAFTNLLGQAADVHWLITGAAVISWAWVVMAGLRRLQGDVVWRLAVGAGVWLVVDLLGLVLIGRFYDHYLIQLIVPASLLSGY